MHRIICLTAAALALAGSARADEKADARAIVEKAIKATGGKEKLAVDQASAVKMKGKFYSTGGGIEFTAEMLLQPPDKMHFKMDFEINAMKIKLNIVVDGKKSWRKVNDDTTELDKDGVAEALEDRHAGRVEALVPLVEDKGFELSTVGEVKVDDKPAVGVRVSHKGKRDVSLFFDKKTGLLVKSERAVKDQEQGGKERMEERLFGGYKEIGGAKRATKVDIKRDGEKFVESEMTEFESKEKIDPSEFAKP